MCSSAAAQCESWLGTPAPSGGLEVRALAVVDHDGPGPALDLLYATKQPAYNESGTPRPTELFVWNRTEWRHVDAILREPLTTRIDAIVSIDEATGGISAGSLVIAGRFQSTDGTIHNLASWDGEQLYPIGPSSSADFSSNFECERLVLWDPDLDGPQLPLIVAAGRFDRIGGIDATNVAGWNGLTWAPVAGGLAHQVRSIDVQDVDGEGPLAPRLTARRRINTVDLFDMCDGTEWTPAPAWIIPGAKWFDPDGPGPRIPAWFALGHYRGLQEWTEAGWQVRNEGWPYFDGLGAGWNGDLLVHDPDGSGPAIEELLVTGRAGNYDQTFAIYGESGWRIPLPQPIDNSWSNADPRQGLEPMVRFDPDGPGPRGVEIVTGGGVTHIGGVHYPGNPTWNGSYFVPLGTEITRGLYVFHHHDADGPGPIPERLYAGGAMRYVDGRPTSSLAVWQDGAWRAVGSSPDGSSLMELATHDPDGYGPEEPWLVGTVHYPRENEHSVKRWDGQAWLPVGDLLALSVLSLRSFDPDGGGPNPPRLFAAGDMQPNVIMVLDGDRWIPTPNSPQATVVRWLHEHDADGPGPAPSMLLAMHDNGVLRWTGASWTPYAGSVSVSNDTYRWRSLSADLDGPGPLPTEFVILADRITTQNGLFRGGAAYDGVRWRALSASSPGFPRRAALLYPPGAEVPQLVVACGTAPTIGAALVRLIEGEWQPIVTNSTANYYAVATHKPGVEGPRAGEVFLGGFFSSVADAPVADFGRWQLSPCCDPDLNCDGSADQSDIACIILAIAGDASCLCQSDPDFNLDGSADQGDVAALISVVAGGDCP